MLSLTCTILKAQNITSPYSILGIGDVDTKDYGRYAASGNAAVSRRDATSYNFSNPASLTALPLKVLFFDISMRGKYSTYKTIIKDTSAKSAKDFIVKRISLAFKLSDKTAIAFGLKPYSSVNYKLQQEAVFLDGNNSYSKLIEGNGGINQVYFSTGLTLNKRISVGLTSSWLFGSLEKTTEYTNSSISLDILKKETDFYTGASIQFGMQYQTLKENIWKHQIGLTGSVSSNLKGELITEYTDETGLIKKEVDRNRKFYMPTTIAIGYTATKDKKLNLSIEAAYYHWKYQKVNYENSYTYPSLRLSAGMDYSFQKHNWDNSRYEKGYIAFGLSAENSYLRVKNEKLMDYSFSFGGGINLYKRISVFTSIEIGKRGSVSSGQLEENYTQFIAGFTLKDIWSGTKKYGRFH